MVIATVIVDRRRLNSINDDAAYQAADVALHEITEELRASSWADLPAHQGGKGVVVALSHTAEAGAKSGGLPMRESGDDGQQHLGERRVGAIAPFQFAQRAVEEAFIGWAWRSTWASNRADLLLQLPSLAADAARPKLPQ
ncbi:MAG: hypothetical protein JNL93_15500 [Pelomonas sp.]|nr:hypothetical protein [Roseateles sp.]